MGKGGKKSRRPRSMSDVVRPSVKLLTGAGSTEKNKMVLTRTRRRTYSGGQLEDYEIDMDKIVVQAMNACKTGNLQKVQTLHQLCCMDFAMADYDSRSPLHQAVEHNHLDVVKYLVLRCGVPLNAPDRWKKCPVSVAREMGNPDIVGFLEEQALRKDWELMEEEAADQEAMAYKFCDAAAKGNIKFLKESHLQGQDLAQVDYDGRSALHLACSENQTAVCKFLLEVLPADSLRIVDRFGNTPLGDAQKSGNEKIAELLRAHCSPIVQAVVSAASEARQKVVFWERLLKAIQDGNDEVVKEVVDEADTQGVLQEVLISTKDQCNQWRKEANMSKKSAVSPTLMVGSSGTPIEEVCHAKKKEYAMMSAMLEKKCQFGVLNSDNMNALIRRRKNRVLQLYLEMTNADPNRTGKGGLRPLYTAIEEGNTGAISLLSKHGANLNEVAQQYTFSPLLYLIRGENRSMDVLEMLLACGADPNMRDSKHGMHPIHHVLQVSYSGAEVINIIKMLFQHQANIDAEDRAGLTALHYISGDAQHRPNQKLNEEERRKIIKFLVDSGSKINHGSNDGSTALHFAVKSEYNSVVRCLLDLGADCHQKNVSNYTAADFPLEGSEIRRLLNNHLRAHSVETTPPSKLRRAVSVAASSIAATSPPQTTTRRRAGSTKKSNIPCENTVEWCNLENAYPTVDNQCVVKIRVEADCPNAPRSTTASTKAHTRSEKYALLKEAFEYLSQRVGDNFAKFSRHLNKDLDMLREKAVLADICYTCGGDGLEEVVYQTLYRWSQRVGHSASLTDLRTALASANMLELKRAFQKQFGADLVREVLSQFSAN